LIQLMISWAVFGTLALWVTWSTMNNVPLLWKQGIVWRGIFRRHIKNFIVKSVLGIHLHLNSLLLWKPRDLLPDIQTEEDLQAIFEANSVSTDNTDTDTAISQTEHSTDTETDATMSESKHFFYISIHPFHGTLALRVTWSTMNNVPLLWKQGIVCRGIFRRHIKNFIVKICLGYPLAS
jgi:hypothetical protein